MGKHAPLQASGFKKSGATISHNSCASAMPTLEGLHARQNTDSVIPTSVVYTFCAHWHGTKCCLTPSRDLTTNETLSTTDQKALPQVEN